MMPVKLLKVEATPTSGATTPRGSERVSITDEARTILRDSPQTPLNWVTIWGPARCGKSFLLNCLTRSDSKFPVSGDLSACTVGADMSEMTLELEEFSLGAGAVGEDSDLTDTPTPSPAIGFVDVEGQGDRHLSHEIILATPLLLLSKVVMFNWMGFPNKATILDRLATMREAATFVNERQRGDSFGHLIVLLRDVRKGEKEAYDLLFGKEDPESAGTHEEAQYMIARNETRCQLQTSFRTTRVVCMPQPHADITGREIDLNEVDPRFAAKLSELRKTLSSILSEPHSFGEQPVLGGKFLLSLLTEVCELVNLGAKNIVPLSMMDSIQQRHIQAVYDKSISVFKEKTSCLQDGPVKSKITTADIVKKSMTAAFNMFSDGTQGLNEEAVAKFQKALEMALDEKAKMCYILQKDQVAETTAKLMGFITARQSDSFNQVLHSILAKLPIAEDADLEDLWEEMCTSMYDDFKSSVIETIPAELYEDLKINIPTLDAFKAHLKGSFTLKELNRKINDKKAKEIAEWRLEVLNILANVTITMFGIYCACPKTGA